MQPTHRREGMRQDESWRNLITIPPCSRPAHPIPPLIVGIYLAPPGGARLLAIAALALVALDVPRISSPIDRAPVRRVVLGVQSARP
jgi:hypothetical protein